MQKGAIRVQTENIFPIIKKFLYSDHEIFIRELVSNAVDATQKLKTLASVGEFKGDLGNIDIEVRLDKEKKTITIADHGVGMSAEEVDKYINQVAFSGAEEFLKKYKGQENGTNIIGHFGLGFYSSFMVSNQVEIFTKSWKESAPAVRWECDGSPEYTLEETAKTERGSEIVMHVNEESEEFLDEGRIRSILTKFCKFLPIPVKFEGEQINNPTPAWTKKPSELTTEDYQNFYKELYPFAEAPLFWIHLNVDYPFNLTGILYFPKITKSYEIQKDKINLYSNQVYVTDEVKDIVPEFLMLLHGVIDSPDIPLNVSRSYLQGDPNVKKINGYITKKVADKLDEMFRTDRKGFEEKWESIGLFVKYGMMTDDKFLDKANKFLVLEDVDGGTFYTQEEYRTAATALQTNKEGKLVVLYATNPIQQDSYIQAAKKKGFKIIKMETLVDAAFINNIEMKWENVQFTRVDADIANNLIDKDENADTLLSKDQEQTLKDLFGKEVNQPNIKVDMKGLTADVQPVIVTRPEFMRRMKDMASMGGGGMNWYANMPDEINMTINANHPVYLQILREKDNGLQQKQIKNLADLALLSQNLLTGADLTAFVTRSVELMTKEEEEA
ncbi:MAG: molecular chaperone HtpG [Chitinophaga sp.]|uniref:molecular chaperone HtpG n=1 Tax=Chitinophaga sp. TaxID=1869181 RepID=UPI0025BDC07F|nr:molecular chaperone HtpG [Chitinophaga sp.]MBV8255762.1 molecular chaperone HtpG [Chitinophaga sp.]